MSIAHQGTAKGEVRKRNWKAILLVVLFFLAVSVGLFLQSPLSKVRDIKVLGTHSLDAPSVIRESGVTRGMSLFKINRSLVTDRLQTAFPLIASVGIHLSLSGTVTLDVMEKRTAGVLLQTGKFYRVLEDGTVLDQLSAKDALAMPLITTRQPVPVVMGKKVTDSSLLKLLAELVKLSPAELGDMSEMHIEDSHQWVAYTKDHFELRLPDSDLGKKLKLYHNFRQSESARGLKPGIVYLYANDTMWYDPYPSSDSSSKGQ